jgi:NADPH:quinone reductase-like Zn-dependent oxidoreductase
MIEVLAFWIVEAGKGELRRERVARPGPDEVLIEAIASGISRGTESLVFRGEVPASQHAAMRAPFQAGEFGFPVKYGYSSVGTVADGPAALRDRRVFCLFPHQDRYVVPAAAVLPVPDDVPDTRAVLAANMETALNGLWDAAPRIGDRIAVVGAGVLGALSAALLSRLPGVELQLIDVDPGKARIAKALGVGFTLPTDATGDADIVIHASGAPEGLATALSLAGFEATVLELGWYGDRLVPAPLGEAFHSRRLTLRSSQVGAVAGERRARWDQRRRLALALRLLADPRLDMLLEPAIPFERLPEIMPALATAPGGAMCQVIGYR